MNARNKIIASGLKEQLRVLLLYLDEDYPKEINEEILTNECYATLLSSVREAYSALRNN